MDNTIRTDFAAIRETVSLLFFVSRTMIDVDMADSQRACLDRLRRQIEG